MEICKQCKYAQKCSASSESDFCLNYEQRPLTNADSIRQMTDRELANQLISEKYDGMKLMLTLLYQNLKDIGIVDEKVEKESFCNFENEVKKIWGQMVEEKHKWLKSPVEEVIP